MFIAERDSEFATQAVVVEISDDPDVDGRVVGWTTGEEALDNADEIARVMSITGHQPHPRKAAGLGYTPKIAF